MIVIEPWPAAYFEERVAGAAEAQDVPRIAVQYRDGSTPHRARCHDNVDRWIDENPSAFAVRGWLISARLGDSWMLEAHSVVRLPDQTRADITLQLADQRAPFLTHVGDDALFLAAKRCVNQICWPPLMAGGIEGTRI